MSLASGSRLGPYEILAPLGAGGMGEVYRARDTRLDRIVALKVLPEHLAADLAACERFEREARSVAALNHPRICTLHDVGAHEGLSFLVMEHLEGETLADRLARHPKGLPPGEAIQIAIEIASALAAAHGRGIVHRDLKPANVMLTRGGSKLLDFGLSKLRPPAVASGASVVTQAPLTGPATILGTLQYMSPEQLQGRDADARSDLFSFGCLLYEMLTGRRAFEGSSAASVIAAILERDPRDLADLMPLAPPLLHDLVRACLIKDVERRWHAAADAERVLAWVAAAGPAASSASPSRWRTWWLIPAAIALLAAGALGGRWLPRVPEDGRAVVLSVVPPAGTSLHVRTTESVDMALSPDGRALAFIGSSPAGVRQLFVRTVDAADARLVDGSDGADIPFWSPDGAMIGFFARGKLKKVSRTGGVPQVVADAGSSPGGGTWNQDGVIVFSPFFEGALYRVAASGGVATPLTTLDPQKGETHHHRPRFLPDGRHFLFNVYARESSGEYVGSLDSPDRTLVTAAKALPAGFMGDIADYAPGYMVYVRDTTLLAQPFDLDRLALTGEPVRIAEGIARTPGGAAAFSAARGAAVVAYRTADPQMTTRLTWFDRTGRATGWAGSPAAYEDPALSPDGSRVAVQRWDTPERRSIWIIDAERGTETRLTTNPDDIAPLWSPDGTRIVFSSARDTPPNLFVRSMSAADSAEDRLFSSRLFHMPTGWSADGRLILYDTLAERTGYDIFAYDRDTRASTPLLQTSADEQLGSLSADGRWLLYQSDETGKREVYVRPARGSGAPTRISTNGGKYPVWRRDGREIFYVEAGRRLMSVALATLSPPTPGPPSLLFEAAFGPANRLPYDVSADGRRVLVNLAVNEAAPSPITIVMNWAAVK